MWHSIESFGYSVTFIDHQDRSARTEARLGCCLTSCSGEPVSVMAAEVDCDHHVGLPAGEQRLGPSRLYSRSGLLATFRGLDSAADHVRQAAGPVVGGPWKAAPAVRTGSGSTGTGEVPSAATWARVSPRRWRRPDTRAAHGADLVLPSRGVGLIIATDGGPRLSRNPTAASAFSAPVCRARASAIRRRPGLGCPVPPAAEE